MTYLLKNSTPIAVLPWNNTCKAIKEEIHCSSWLCNDPPIHITGSFLYSLENVHVDNASDWLSQSPWMSSVCFLISPSIPFLSNLSLSLSLSLSLPPSLTFDTKAFVRMCRFGRSEAGPRNARAVLHRSPKSAKQAANTLVLRITYSPGCLIAMTVTQS